MRELVFEITEEPGGIYTAEAQCEAICARGSTVGELLRNVSDAIEAFYFDSPMPSRVRLGLMKDRIQLLPGWDAPVDLLCDCPDGGSLSYPVK